MRANPSALPSPALLTSECGLEFDGEIRWPFERQGLSDAGAPRQLYRSERHIGALVQRRIRGSREQGFWNAKKTRVQMVVDLFEIKMLDVIMLETDHGPIPHHVMPLSEHRRDKVNLSDDWRFFQSIDALQCLHAATTFHPASFSDSSTCRTARLSGLHSAPVDLAGSIDSAIATASDGSTKGPQVGLRSARAAVSITRWRADLRLLTLAPPASDPAPSVLATDRRRAAPSYSRAQAAMRVPAWRLLSL